MKNFNINIDAKSDKGNFLIILVIAFIVFSPSFLNLNFFWDDERFIFANPIILNAKSFFDFWIPGQLEYRTWSLGYSIFWLLNKIFFTNTIIFFKTFNIFIHALNAFIFGKILKLTYFKKNYLIYSILFLIHPLHVETVSWIFQLLTLIASTFYLISVLFFIKYLKNESKNKLFLSYLFFFFSLQTKSIFIFASFVYLLLIFLFRKNFNILKSTIPFFIISLIIGLISLGNANHVNKRSSHRNTYNPNMLLQLNLNTVKKSEDNKITPKIKTEIESFQNNYEKVDVTRDERNFKFDRLEIFKESIWYYAKNIVLPIDNFFLYPKQNINVGSTILIIIVLFLLPIYFLIKKKDTGLFIVASIFWITLFPFIGTTMIPYYVLSYVSDHYAYAACTLIPFLILFIEKKLPKFIRPILISFIMFFSIQTIRYGYTFNNPINLYEKISENNLNPRILASLFEEYISKGDLKNMERILNLSVKNFPETNATKNMQTRFNIYKLNF